jgi:hypothetical protein
MPTALVVFESIFGDARKIGEAIADGLGGSYDVEVRAAGEAPPEIGPEVALLVVGGPNHAMSMPRQSTRESAVKQHGVSIENTGAGLHEWLDAVRLPTGIQAAAYDTRLEHPKLLVKLDHASRTEEKLLKKHGARLVAPAEHFHVTDAKGPLADGEEDRARAWGSALAEKVLAGSQG